MTERLNIDEFYGRNREIDILRRSLSLNIAKFIVIKGRRRIGKSRLLAEFAKSVDKAYIFSGIAPTKKTTAQSQRDEFARQMRREMGVPYMQSDDWGDLFWYMANQVQTGEVLIVLDEITWMGSKDDEFLSKLKNIWDLHLKQNPKLILAVCGSMSAWIEENILSSTGYFGRPTVEMTLRELPLPACDKFWGDKQISNFEKLKFLAVSGGVPRYLELMNPSLTAEQNIRDLFFTEDSVLFHEFDRTFSDLYGKRKKLYRDVINTLVKKKLSQVEISDKLKLSKSGDLGKYLENLELCGFISRDYTWDLTRNTYSKFSRYRISDNYIRFYLKYIRPNKIKIEKGDFEGVSISGLPGWDSIMGIQFENIVINNRSALIKRLDIDKLMITNDGPYFQTETLRSAACQVDYIIQTKETIYVFEIKFSRKPIRYKVIAEVKDKISKLECAKHYSIRPVLVHVNGAEPAVIKSDYFTKVIDFGELFKE